MKLDDTTLTAGVVLTRERAGTLEVLWARRTHSAGFLAGFYSYFVGRLEDADEHVPLDMVADELDVQRGFVACALRELFEESGLLVLGDHIISPASDPEQGADGPLGAWEDYRRELIAGAAHLPSDLSEAGLQLGASRLERLGRWRTPGWLEGDYLTEFFQLHLSEDEAASLAVSELPHHVAPSEIARTEWIEPAEAIERWWRGEALMTYPITAILELLRDTPADERYAALDRRRAKDRENAPMELIGGVRVLALQTTPLPPATHTNCYIVGDERFVVVDPGSDEPSQAALVESAVDELRRQGKHLEAVVLTHHHPDHIGGAAGLVNAYSAPVWAHAETAERVDLHVERRLDDGEVIDLGDDSLTCLHTPGHAPGHLCLHHQRSDSILAGDLVASKGTIIINPPNGHLGDYMNSLERVRSLQPRTIFPAHGWAITRPKEALDYYIEHRRERDREVFEALRSAQEPAAPEQLVPQVYDDVPEHVWPLAARSLLAHLLHMVEDGRAQTDGERFWIAD